MQIPSEDKLFPSFMNRVFFYLFVFTQKKYNLLSMQMADVDEVEGPGLE